MGRRVPAANRDPQADRRPRAAPSGGNAVTPAGTIEAVSSEAPLRLMTAEELLRYSHEPYRQELIDGRLHEMEPTGAEHGLVEGRIYALLARHVDAAVSARRSSATSASRSRRTRTRSARRMLRS